jgi:putative aldouronate transport system permease protein
MSSDRALTVALRKRKRHLIVIDVVRDYQLYLILLPPLIFIFIFNYMPMYGAQIAFKNFRAVDGIWGSPWAGFKHFTRFFTSPSFFKVLKNTFSLSLYSLAAGFPFPVILALSLNALRNLRLKKTIQTFSYMPHFISMTVMVGMILQFLSPRQGIVNRLMGAVGIASVSFMTKPEFFRSVYVWTGIWQNIGWGSIIYLAALSAINPELHEAALADGANRLQRIRHIDIPGILPTATILLILSAGQLINVGFEKVFLMQNDLNLSVSEVIQTFVYKIGIASAMPNYSYSTAVGLFNSVISLALVAGVNLFARKFSETSLW